MEKNSKKKSELPDPFPHWDRYYANFEHTRDVRKAATWTRYQLEVEEKRKKRLELQAQAEVNKSLAKVKTRPKPPPPRAASALANEQVIEARRLAREKGMHALEFRSLTWRFGVSLMTLINAALGLTYKHLNRDYPPVEE